MVETLTELGVDRLVLLNTQRTIVNPSDTKVDKLRDNVVAACKQCRRPVLMDNVQKHRKLCVHYAVHWVPDYYYHKTSLGPDKPIL